MKNIKKAYIILGTTILSISAFTGCNKPENNCSLVSTFSSSIINANKAIVQRDGYKVDAEIGLNEGQAIDREGSTEIEGANASQGEVADSNVEVVEHTALTQEEIDELKANATTDMAKRGIDAYESIINTGSCEHNGFPVNEAVGKPGDTSWRRMTDEEAQAALDKNINDIIAKAELKAGTWNKFYDGKVYFNPYEYVEAMRANVESTPDVIHDFE